jgi:hypothetical protein
VNDERLDDVTRPYADGAAAVLPGILARFDRNPVSPTFGVGDRLHWAWGLIDFPNATFQSVVHGMARLWVNDLWPLATDAGRFVDRMDSAVKAVGACTARDGSLSEAFPGEGSWCVTALVAFDVLAATELMRSEIGDELAQRWVDVVEPLIRVLRRTDETHAFISNHLATGAAALHRWADVTGSDESRQKAEHIIGRIIDRQHPEGWYLEYQGADPGYQSLATYYLADIVSRRDHPELSRSLARSVEFVRHFAHPDGSFGGAYGSRNTRFFVPAGFHLLAATSADARALAVQMAHSVRAQTVVTLTAIDAPNLPPLFNAYCLAATTPVPDTPTRPLPAFADTSARVEFPGAGLLVDAGPRHYTVVGTKKGGVVQHYVDGHEAVVDCGPLYRRGNDVGSPQAFDESSTWTIDGSQLIVDAAIRSVVADVPKPWQFAALRIASLTVLRVRRLREWLKRRLVRRLITGPKRWDVRNLRTIDLGPNLRVSDIAQPADRLQRVHDGAPFSAIHMASQGYWQVQDERKA